MRLAAPAMLKLRAGGDDEQDWQPPNSIDRYVEKLARGRVDPMRVLEHHQHGSFARPGCELTQQRFEQHLPLALGTEVRPAAEFGNDSSSANSPISTSLCAPGV